LIGTSGAEAVEGADRAGPGLQLARYGPNGWNGWIALAELVLAVVSRAVALPGLVFEFEAALVGRACSREPGRQGAGAGFGRNSGVGCFKSR